MISFSSHKSKYTLIDENSYFPRLFPEDDGFWAYEISAGSPAVNTASYSLHTLALNSALPRHSRLKTQALGDGLACPADSAAPLASEREWPNQLRERGLLNPVFSSCVFPLYLYTNLKMRLSENNLTFCFLPICHLIFIKMFQDRINFPGWKFLLFKAKISMKIIFKREGDSGGANTLLSSNCLFVKEASAN